MSKQSKSGKSMVPPLKHGGGKTSALDSLNLPGQKLVISSTPRMLDLSEIDLLRQDLQATVQVLHLKTAAG